MMYLFLWTQYQRCRYGQMDGRHW